MRCPSIIIPLLDLPGLVDMSCGLVPNRKRCTTWACPNAGGLVYGSRWVGNDVVVWWGISEKKGLFPKLKNYLSPILYYLPPLRIFSSHNYVLIRDICL